MALSKELTNQQIEKTIHVLNTKVDSLQIENLRLEKSETAFNSYLSELERWVAATESYLVTVKNEPETRVVYVPAPKNETAINNPADYIPEDANVYEVQIETSLSEKVQNAFPMTTWFLKKITFQN
jgi:hypothetical protein